MKFISSTLAFCAALLTMTAEAQTPSSAMDSAFGNTVQVVDGETRYSAYYNEDGTFENSLGISGTWTLEGDLLSQFVAGESIGSTVMPSRYSVGDTFEMADENGKTATITISEGRE